MPDRYALLDLAETPDDESRWWLYLYGVAGGGIPFLNDRPMDEGAERGWWSAPADPGVEPETWALEVERPGGKRTVGYNRTPDIVSDRYPERLTVEEYVALTDDGEPTYDERVRALYQPEYEETPPTREPVEGPWLRLDGEPPPADGLTWMATLPHALANRREYLHLFPGHLVGFVDALKEGLNAIGGVDAYTSSGKIDVYVKVWLPKRTPVPDEAKPDLSHLSRTERRQRAARLSSTEERVTRHLAFRSGDRVGGLNRAEATQHWNDLLSERVGYVRTLVSTPCPTCAGHGFVEPDHDREEATTA